VPFFPASSTGTISALKRALLRGGPALLRLEREGVAVSRVMPYFTARFSAVMAIGVLQKLSVSAAKRESSRAGRAAEGEAVAGAAEHVGRLGHVLGAAHEHGLGLAQEDLLGAVDDGLKARAAQAVDGERRAW
jgi:hypothetical protein